MKVGNGPLSIDGEVEGDLQGVLKVVILGDVNGQLSIEGEVKVDL